MFSKLKLYIVLSIIAIGIGIFVSQFLNNHTYVSNEFIKQKNDSVLSLKHDVLILDSLVWSLQQDFDINKSNEWKYQITIKGLSAENKRLRDAENTCCEELQHAEENGGIVRDTVYLNFWGKEKKKK